jgi:LmbE family N-acetylglucosaminyl deacetylase
MSELRLMCVLAHPDDESLGTGGLLAKCAADGVATSLVTATRGEYGWSGPADAQPAPEALGRLREAELRAAAAILGLGEVVFLDYLDGMLDQADPAEAVGKIVTHLRRVRPQVVVTNGPEGWYGHPDHMAICQFTSAALVRAADPAYSDPEGRLPHQVLKYYYAVDTEALVQVFEPLAGGPITMDVDGVTRRQVGWPEWAITTRLDAEAHWRTVLQAILCHRSQLTGLPALDTLPEATHKQLWGWPTLIRAFSLVNGGRAVEPDLFAGLR